MPFTIGPRQRAAGYPWEGKPCRTSRSETADASAPGAADLLVYPVLTRDRQAMSELVHDTLGPLTAARGGAQPLLDWPAAEV